MNIVFFMFYAILSNMKQSHFLLLTVATVIATYFMNASLLAGHFFIAGIYAFILFRNLHFAYKVTKAIRLFERNSKKSD